jgi:hypothetical protein
MTAYKWYFVFVCLVLSDGVLCQTEVVEDYSFAGNTSFPLRCDIEDTNTAAKVLGCLEDKWDIVLSPITLPVPYDKEFVVFDGTHCCAYVQIIYSLLKLVNHLLMSCGQGFQC